MSYLVVVSFDLTDAPSDTYQAISQEMNDVGLRHWVVSKDNMHLDLPATTFSGEFNGESSTKIRDDISNQVRGIISRHGIRSKIFISVGSEWAWGTRST